jgi:ABC-type antimicrobial peptide transport system permease subunit
MWIDTRGHSTQALRKPPFAVLDVSTRTGTLAQLRADPLGRGAVLVLGSAALAALALALAGVLLALVSDLRDERGELFDLESQGAEPRTLLRHLRLRFLISICFGIAGGLVAGVILSALTVGLIRLTAGAGEPVPPLRLAVDWPLVVIALAAFLVAALLPAFVLTRARFREAL